MPISIQIEKLTLDEFFYNMTGRFDLAASIACQSVALLKQHPAIQDRSPDTLPKLFRKLSTFYAELKDIEKLRDVISQFEAESPTSETRRKHYLPRYIFALFQASIDCDLPDFAVKGMDLLPKDGEMIIKKSRTLQKSRASIRKSIDYNSSTNKSTLDENSIFSSLHLLS